MQSRVLVVEDAPFLLEVLTQMLEKLGAVIVGQAHNGNEAVQMASRLKPELIFMDLVLPELNGLQAAEKILAENKKMKIVVCSTLDQEEVMLEAIAIGCIDFIKKPFTKAELQKVLEKCALTEQAS